MSDTRPTLPLGWAWAPLGDLALEIRNGISVAPREESGTRILRISAVRPLVLDIDDVRYLPGDVSDYETYMLKEGDVLFTRYNGNVALVGASAHVQHLSQPTVYPDKLIRVRLHESVAPMWIPAATSSGYSRNHINLKTRSTAGQAGISGADLKKMPVPVAPRREQRRVVRELDSYISRLDAAVAGLKRVQANLKRYRASVLKAAVEGRLVPTEAELARAEGRTYEPATELLARILKERRARWEAAELAAMQAKGKPPNDDKWKSKYKAPAAPDIKGLPMLPEGWCWATVDHFLTDIEAGKSFRCDERPPGSGEVGVVKVSAVTWGTFDERESKTSLRKDLFNERWLIRTGDFLFSRANTIALVGACVIVGNVEGALMLSDKILRLRTVGDLDSWLLHVLRSPHGRAEIESLATGNQDSMRNIGQSRIRDIRIPLPPMREVDRLLDEISKQLSVEQHAETAAVTNSTRAGRLRQAILKWAFEGKLVDQDANDEPASALLARIRAEREATTKAKKRLDPKTKSESAPKARPRKKDTAA